MRSGKLWHRIEITNRCRDLRIYVAIILFPILLTGSHPRLHRWTFDESFGTRLPRDRRYLFDKYLSTRTLFQTRLCHGFFPQESWTARYAGILAATGIGKTRRGCRGTHPGICYPLFWSYCFRQFTRATTLFGCCLSTYVRWTIFIRYSCFRFIERAYLHEFSYKK